MSLRSGKSVEARRVGTSLVAAFHKANPPLIWRFDLARNHSFTLVLRKSGDQWILGLAPGENEFHPVACFASHAEAEEAFVTVEKILATSPYAWVRTTLKFFGFVAGGGGVCALLFLLCLWGLEVIRGLETTHTTNQAFIDGSPISPSQPPKSAAAPVAKPGIPLPADEYLKPPP